MLDFATVRQLETKIPLNNKDDARGEGTWAKDMM
jgi:hypothetical protein